MRRALCTAVLAAWLAAGCGNGGTNLTVDLGTPDQAADMEVREATPDVPQGEATEQVAEVMADEQAEETSPACPEGKGCFLEPCGSNADCLSGWCVQHMGDNVCSQVCELECPDGWSCRQVGTGPDILSICVSAFANLCRPCRTSAECKSAGGAEDVCVQYGAQGAFCGGKCSEGDKCPWGFSCKQAQTVDDLETTQCVADAGECPCADASVDLALFTDCAVVNEWGWCNGKRVCTQDGLTPCDAPAAAEESCNGKDDDCDAGTDEPLEVGGDYLNLCDDGNPCTQDKCGGEGGCSHKTLSEGECMDGDACTVGDHCAEGVCTGTPVLCDDKNPCTDDSCDGLGGCVFANNSQECDDGDPCTVADLCKGGACQGFAVPCDCLADKDCAVLEDGDKCNGTLVCDTGEVPYQCAVDMATVVTCPEAEGKNGLCQKAWCDPVNGKCGLVPDHEGLACDDGDACSLGDHCAAGTCVAGGAALCNDGDPCTDDLCLSETGCQHAFNAAACSDGDTCTLNDHCQGGQCVGGGTLACDDGNLCTADSCDSKVGCVHTFSTEPCDDGNACTLGDTCSSGACVAEALKDCDDSNPCTADSCVKSVGCMNIPVPGGCDDGNLCTVGDKCVNGTCQGGTAQNCDDSNPCTEDSCNKVGLCDHKAKNGGCDDGNACTPLDVCAQGKCTGTGALDCDDGNLCTDDSCAPADGCIHSVNQGPCSDGDLCTTGDQCKLGVCSSSGKLQCDDSNPCTDDSCTPAAGCQFKANLLPCDDGNACSVGDQCAKGWCVPGPALTCSDDNVCTADSCSVTLGCQHEPIPGNCDDLNACTVGDACLNGKCQPGAPLSCNDQNVCTDNACDPKSGCVFTPNAGACDDGNACTAGDKCSGGGCVPSGQLNCDDANPCTTDACDSKTGCTHVPVQNGTNCGGTKTCVDGQCTECGNIHGSQTFSYTGQPQTFAVPACVTQVTLEAWGGQGGSNAAPAPTAGGLGGYAKGNLTVIPGQTLNVFVGASGDSGGWNGGGKNASSYGPGKGGGASDVRVGGAALSNRVLVAGGGGGNPGYSHGYGGWNGAAGGAGGGTEGTAGQPSNGNPPPAGGGGGGTQTGGGALGVDVNNGGSLVVGSAGSLGQGGSGSGENDGDPCGSAGSGGGGYYGGGGGGHQNCGGGGGGGGASYVGGVSGGSTSAGINGGNGKIVITW